MVRKSLLKLHIFNFFLVIEKIKSEIHSTKTKNKIKFEIHMGLEISSPGLEGEPELKSRIA